MPGSSALVPRATAAVAIALALSACRGPAHASTTELRLTDAGRFRVSLVSDVEPVPLHHIHSWTLRVETPDGKPVTGATVTMAGGMPEHSHGLPTVPEVVEGAAPGTYRVEGMRFSMPGRWTLTPTIWADGVRDAATFDVVLR